LKSRSDLLQSELDEAPLHVTDRSRRTCERRSLAGRHGVLSDDWDGAIGGTLVASVDLTNAQFCAEIVTNCQSYTSLPFHFDAPVTIQAGHDYIATLTSTVDSAQADAYFIKGPQTFNVQDPSGNALPPADTTNTPEPASWMMLAPAGFLVAFRLRKRLA